MSSYNWNCENCGAEFSSEDDADAHEEICFSMEPSSFRLAEPFKTGFFVSLGFFLGLLVFGIILWLLVFITGFSIIGLLVG